MDVKVLGSSSKGNSYLLSDGHTTILIECGLPFMELKKRSQFMIPSHIDGCLVTHEHMDHSKAVKELLNFGVDVYALESVFESHNVKRHHRAHIINPNDESSSFNIGSFIITAYEMFHDVPCVGYLIYSGYTDELLLFATDTRLIKYAFKSLDYIMIEANYDIDLVNDDAQLKRLVQSHMSIENTIDYLLKLDLSSVKEIYLMHLSSRNSNAKDFKKRVQIATGKPVIICDERGG